MKNKRQSYHDRYFSDYQALRIPNKDSGTYRTVYQYVGLFKAWENHASCKWQCGILEILSIMLFLICATCPVEINRAKLASGFGIAAVVPWLLEISGIFRFILSKRYVRELTWKEIDGSIRYGCSFRGTLMMFSGIAGMAQAMGNESAVDWLVLAGILVSGAISFVIRQRYASLPVNTYRNQNGTPGKQF